MIAVICIYQAGRTVLSPGTSLTLRVRTVTIVLSYNISHFMMRYCLITQYFLFYDTLLFILSHNIVSSRNIVLSCNIFHFMMRYCLIMQYYLIMQYCLITQHFLITQYCLITQYYPSYLAKLSILSHNIVHLFFTVA